jgi:rubrerythrin
MAGIFKANEVVGIAVEIEKRGEAFYKEIARKARNQSVKETLEFLAGEEVKHQQYFLEILSRMDAIEIPAGSRESEYWAYVNDLIDSHFLFDDSLNRRLMAKALSDIEAVHLAMGFEKESILFFTEMKDLVPRGEVPTVEKCILEERRHLRKLVELAKFSS